MMIYIEYLKTYTVRNEHSDIQGIMGGLYYPFYMEWCWHDYIKEVPGFDFEEQARNGVNMVLSSYKADRLLCGFNLTSSSNDVDQFSFTGGSLRQVFSFKSGRRLTCFDQK